MEGETEPPRRPTRLQCQLLWYLLTSCEMVHLSANCNPCLNTQMDHKTSRLRLAYPQAKIKSTIYMKLPYGIRTKRGMTRSHVLKLKQTSTDKSKQDECVFNILPPNSVMLGSNKALSMNASSIDATSSSSSTLMTKFLHRPTKKKSIKQFKS